jgi:FkbM family methyltransferase
MVIQTAGPTGERHRLLRSTAKALYTLPGSKTSLRTLTRLTLQSLPVSVKNKQRLYNFFAADTVPAEALTCDTRLPSGQSIKLTLDLHDDLSRMWYYWGYNGYEPATVRLFCELLRSKSCVFDVGANIGYYTLLAATALEGRGEVHAFEPCPRIFRQLYQNVDPEVFRSTRLSQAALTDTDGQQRLFLPADSAGTNASLIENFTKQDASVMTQTTRFDSYCRRHVTRKVDLLKIDAEGAEASVLRGTGPLLDEWRPDIICEVLTPFENELNRFFTGRQYRKFLITDDGLKEKDKLEAHPQIRDYYLSTAPSCL